MYMNAYTHTYHLISTFGSILDESRADHLIAGNCSDSSTKKHCSAWTELQVHAYVCVYMRMSLQEMLKNAKQGNTTLRVLVGTKKLVEYMYVKGLF